MSEAEELEAHSRSSTTTSVLVVVEVVVIAVVAVVVAYLLRCFFLAECPRRKSSRQPLKAAYPRRTKRLGSTLALYHRVTGSGNPKWVRVEP